MEGAQTAASMSRLPLRATLLMLAELTALTWLSWLYLLHMPMTVAEMGGVVARILAPMPASWVEVWPTFMMWAVMMVAMMVPSASPMILSYARIAQGRTTAPEWHATMFALGYVVVWTAYSAGATALQFGLERVRIVSSGSVATPIAGATILIATGIYQFSPLKKACLGICQSPLAFLMTRWRDGAIGALTLGLEHGAFCLGCCWMLMALLFVAGVMNLVWVAAITAFVLIEKVTPYPLVTSNVTGVLLILAGVIVGTRGIMS